MRNMIDDLAVDMVKADLPGKYTELVEVGEAPYQQNRRAAFALNILGYDDEGIEELKKLSESIVVWIEELERFLDDAKRLATQAAAAVF